MEDDGNEIRTYRLDDGRWVVAQGYWLPGNYDAQETATAAASMTDAQLAALEQRICWVTTGEGRAITMEDLRAAGYAGVKA